MEMHPESRLVFNVDTTENQNRLYNHMLDKLGLCGDDHAMVERREITEDRGNTVTLYVVVHTSNPLFMMAGLHDYARSFGIL
jgi:hypothetical protein